MSYNASTIYRKKELWKTSLIGCRLKMTVVFAEYLGIDYLKTRQEVPSKLQSRTHDFIGMASGGPLVTTLSNKLQSRLLLIKCAVV